ncbi:sel1 repeat family protein [Xenophilus arseniciresistens]|uniref:Sel1 repeat family protein n=1 Tax=Xenophilus arseniciresistens TaxID=1283306 RepID=A0AAE3T2I1_9BURK|nr:sel1 repeat family protein [Xenophilus arseniciresistens]MDA7419091.1 sel1 repeat family protein [Xenophilus arseniciresistens]
MKVAASASPVRSLIGTALLLCAAGTALAQTTYGTVTGPAANAARASAAAAGADASAAATAGATGAVPGTPAQTSGARYVEACQQALERGQVNAGCQGPLYASEIARLKEDALRSNNPNLLTLLGDAYQSNRTGISDIGQAYRWYLLGAVRGDPRAMQRLSELYRSGRGAPVDNVKAMGYARLAQKMAPPGSASAQQATQAIESLGRDMAAEEVGLAERFAAELESGLHAQGAGAGTAPGMAGALPGQPAPGAASAPPLGSARLPGLGAARVATEPAAPGAAPHQQLTSPAGGPTSPPPLGGLPGVPAAPPALPRSAP